MNDPVSRELERRLGQPLHWRFALAVAVAVHLLVALALVIGPAGRHRALTLPRVQVRLTAGIPALPGGGGAARRSGPPASHPAAAVQEPAPKPAPAARKPEPKAAARKAKTAPVKKSSAPSKKVAAEDRPTGPPPPPAAPVKPGASAEAAGPAAEGPAVTPASTTGGSSGTAAGAAIGGVGLGSGGAGATDESFPFAYYLNRVLAIIESNWFRPPAAPGTQCRVLCRIERSGRLVEAGIEVPSTTPAFDRAALRAVYASAPLPPLPQGYSGSTLTLHLEFGP